MKDCPRISKVLAVLLLSVFAICCTTFLNPVPAVAQDSVGAGFVFVEQSDLRPGEKQTVAVILDREDIVIEDATLFYEVDGQVYEEKSSVVADNSALFSFQVDLTGQYVLDSVTASVASDSAPLEIAIDGEGSTACVFSVVDDSSALGIAPMSLQSDTGLGAPQSTSFITEGENGELKAFGSLNNVAESFPAAQSRNADSFTVALDPGHGGNDPGAVYGSLQEKNLTLSISQYCRDALLGYGGVSVYMTHDGSSNPSIYDRVNDAIDSGANVIVSIHINSGGGSGAEVWYPNDSSWKNEETHGEGQGLSQNILDKLVALGLNDRGIKMRDYPNDGSSGSHYADGSTADYYGILRYARQRGVLGIIVEHAFIDNSHDYNMLSNNATLKAMGEADAAGIAQTFGLRTNDKWVEDEKGLRYYVNGSFIRDGWFLVDGSWYWSNSEGYAVKGWQEISGSKYYFNDSCAMVRGWMEENGNRYYFTYSGHMVTGWQFIDGKWYLFDKDGVMLTGWQESGGKRYYLDEKTGSMVTGWANVGGSWYYLSTDGGAMVTGWASVGGSWYYLDPNAGGAMATGRVLVDGRWCKFDSSGAWLGYDDVRTGWVSEGGVWRYYSSSGSMVTGWANVGGSWYYLDPNAGGAMAKGWIDVDGSRYLLGDNGAMKTGWQSAGDSWYNLGSSGAWDGIEQKNETILGNPSSDKDVLVEKMVTTYNSVAAYPAEQLKLGGASTITDFCTQLYEEAVAEGVRPELLFCQVMKETGWLRFGGSVKIEQFNFGGLGATGETGAVSASFESVRLGLRAQSQHLKAYSTAGITSSSLSNPCVDPRFDLVVKGSAPYIQWLGISENPNGVGWATGSGYGCSIVSMMHTYF